MIKEIPSVGRKSFDIPTLTFSVERVESQWAFSASTKASNNCQAVTRNGSIDIFQIVHTGTIYIDCFQGEMGYIYILRTDTLSYWKNIFMCNKGMHSFRGRKTICAKSKEIFVGILEIFVERSETYTNIKGLFWKLVYNYREVLFGLYAFSFFLALLSLIPWTIEDYASAKLKTKSLKNLWKIKTA